MKLMDENNYVSYGLIIIIFIFVFNKIDIKINIIFGIFLAVLIIINLRKDEVNVNEEYNDNKNIKIDTIRPPINYIKKYDEFLDFVFSISTFYTYNPPNFEDMVDSIEDFLVLYEETLNDNSKASNNYSLAESKSLEAINSLHSFVYNIPQVANKYYDEKMEIAQNRLSFLMNKFLCDIEDLHKKYLYSKGYNNKTKLIITGPKPSNLYVDNDNDIYSFNVHS